MVRFKQKMGRGQIEIEAQDFKQICSAMDLVGRFPEKCSMCGSDDLHLYHKMPKGNEYFGIRCRSCGAEQSFHQKKDGGFYIKYDDKFEKYQGGGESSERSDSNDGKKFDEDKIPF